MSKSKATSVKTIADILDAHDCTKEIAKALDVKPPVQSQPQEILYQVYLLLDEVMAKMLAGHEVSCRRGCNACCYQQVMVTQLEVDVFIDCIDTKHPSAVNGLLPALFASALSAVSSGGVTGHFKRQVPCGFLDSQGECSIYDLRPSPCRYYWVTTPPSHCKPSKTGEPLKVRAANSSAFTLTILRTGHALGRLQPVMPLGVAVLGALLDRKQLPLEYVAPVRVIIELARRAFVENTFGKRSGESDNAPKGVAVDEQ